MTECRQEKTAAGWAMRCLVHWRRATWVAMVGFVGGLMACEPSSATDKPRGHQKLREMNEHNTRNAPTIPMSEQVGCEVCPLWCQYVDLHRLPISELFRHFRHNAETAYDLTRSPELGARSRAKRELHRISCIVKRSGPEVKEAFFAYFDDESPIVQVATADLALNRDLARERAYEVLRRNRSSPGRIGFTAQVLLGKWMRTDDPLGSR